MSPAIRIAPARPEDAAACARIMSDWIDETPWIPRVHTRAEDRGFLEHLIGRGWVSVAWRGDAIAGFIARDGSEIHALYVAGPQRGRGVGKALLDAARAARPELDLWTFQANTRARAFYRREGFHETRRSDGTGNDEGLPDIRYHWSRA